MHEVVRGDKQPEKICKLQRTNQCPLRTLYWFVLCNLQIFSGGVCHLEQLHAQSPFLFPIVLVFIWCLFSILAQYSLSFVLVCASLLEPLRCRNCRRLWLWQLGFGVSLRAATSNLSLPPPPPPPTTLIPHIEVGFKWMWTQLATPNKMAPVFVDLCAGLVVLLPRQIRRFRHGFFSSAVLDWSLRSCLRVRHLWRQQIADNRQYLRRSFLPWTSSLRSQISLSKRR